MADPTPNLPPTLDGFEDYKPVEFPFTYDGKKYVLKEASGACTNEYRKAQARGAKLTDGKITSDMIGIIESELILLGGSVHSAETGKPVGIDAIRSWPNPLLEQLYKVAKHISFKASSGEGDDPKKSPSGSTDGSGSAVPSG